MNNIKKKSIKKSPLRVVKRADISKKQSFLLYLISVIGALILGAIFIAMMGVNPFEFYAEILSGCFKNEIYFEGLIRTIMPLVITSLGIAVSFKMKFWNIGAEGQFIMGALGATIVGLFVSGLSHFALLLLMAISGMVFAGLYALIPAIFKVKFGTNETLLTLMFNYIALYIVCYLTKVESFKKPNCGFPTIKVFPENAFLDQVFGIDITWIICILLTVLLYVYFKHSKHGYELTVVGESKATANYAGMSVKKIVLRTMFLSGAIIGLAGMLQVSGQATSHQLSSGITSGVGWTGIIVAWLARLNPIGIFVASILMGILEKGTGVAQSTFNISPAVADILQGIILFSVLGLDFFSRYKIVLAKKNDKNFQKTEDNGKEQELKIEDNEKVAKYTYENEEKEK